MARCPVHFASSALFIKFQSISSECAPPARSELLSEAGEGLVRNVLSPGQLDLSDFQAPAIAWEEVEESAKLAFNCEARKNITLRQKLRGP